MCTVTRLILSEIFYDEDRDRESVDFAPRRAVGAGFLMVGCGRLDAFPISFARHNRVHSLFDTDLGSDVDFPAQVRCRLAGCAVVA